MKHFADLERRHAAAGTLRLWLLFLACAAVAALLIAALQRVDTAFGPPPVATTSPAPTPARAAAPERPPAPRAEFAPTFADAAASLRTGRYADAYGRFVALADEGDVDAGRIALVMHRYGREVFASDWDASVEQLAEWTRWSAAAAERDLAQLRAVARGAGVGGGDGPADAHQQLAATASARR